MNSRRAFLLSPYALPTDHPLVLSESEMASWWNGYLALWHPAILAHLSEPPRQASQYDHEQPLPDAIYALPVEPDLFLPTDWWDRVQQAGALAISAGPDRATTLQQWRSVGLPFDATADAERRLALPYEKMRPFLALGFGYLVVESLFDAMHHEHLLAVGEFWQAVQEGVAAVTAGDDDSYLRPLRTAADKLQAAREVLYPVGIHWLDFYLPDEHRLAESTPERLSPDHPVNFIVSGTILEKWQRDLPERFADLKRLINDSSGTSSVELCLGAQVEREDSLLPVSSQLWNLRAAVQSASVLTGKRPKIYARRRSAFSPMTPQWAIFGGFESAVFLAFDDQSVPTHRSTVISWSAPDGRQLNAWTRAPHPAYQAQTFFNIVRLLHETIMQDTTATLALLHTAQRPAACYEDCLELSRLAPVLGTWTTLSRYLNEASAGEYAPANTPDDFTPDFLDERCTTKQQDVVSAFARHHRLRRRLDVTWGYLAMIHGLGAGPVRERADMLERQLRDLEREVETDWGNVSPELIQIEEQVGSLLVERLQVRAETGRDGFMFLNPCSFTRRLAVELDDLPHPIPIEGPIKAGQWDNGKSRLVVEVPAFGFAWVPRKAAPSVPPKPRMRLADANIVRNEFFEAEVDPKTGGLKAFRDARTRVNRLGQQLVFNPGSRMEAKHISVTANGAALGEIVSEGALMDDHDQILATFRQRYRAWLGRPLLDLRIEVFPQRQPEGYPWHAYYAARFAWREERATLFRGSNGCSHLTQQTRPSSGEFLEIRLGHERTTIFPGGLPFIQRHGGRMADIILIAQGETAQVFELALGLEREYPGQTALGFVTPVTAIPTTKGPPPVGPSGWLFHLDAPNLLLVSLQPVVASTPGPSALEMCLLETSNYGGSAELRCVRNPVRAYSVNAWNEPYIEFSVQDDRVTIDYAASELLRLRIEFP
jgi:hypothetical protein